MDRTKSAAPVRVGFCPTPRMHTRLPSTIDAAARNIIAAEKSPATSHENAGSWLTTRWIELDDRPGGRHGDIQRSEKTHHVVARDDALVHVGGPIGVEPREKKCALDIGLGPRESQSSPKAAPEEAMGPPRAAD